MKQNVSAILLALSLAPASVFAGVVTYAFNPLSPELSDPSQENDFTPPRSTSLTTSWEMVRVSGDAGAPASLGTTQFTIDPSGGEFDSVTVGAPVHTEGLANLNFTHTSIVPHFTGVTSGGIADQVDWVFSLDNLPSAPSGYEFSNFLFDADIEGFRQEDYVTFTDAMGEFGLAQSSGTTQIDGEVPNYSYVTLDRLPDQVYLNPWEGLTEDPGSSRTPRISFAIQYRSTNVDVPVPGSLLLVGVAALVMRRRKK